MLSAVATLQRCGAAIMLVALFLATLVTASNEGSDRVPETMRRTALRTHTWANPLLDPNMQNRWFEFGGDTIIRNNDVVSLTVNRPSKAGWLFSKVPLTATNFQIVVEFKIHGTGSLYGDGLALWLTEERAKGGNVFGSIDKWTGLGIAVDTYKNNRPGTVFPYVVAMNGDGKTTYDKHNDGKANELAGCSVRGVRNAKSPTKMRVTFFRDKFLAVDMMYKSEGEWTPCFTVENYDLPRVPYLGFSAETGDLVDFHEIVSVQSWNLYEPAVPETGSKRAPNNNYGNRNAFRKPEKKGWGWGWILVLLTVAGGAGWVGFTMYRASQARRSHRF